MVVDTALDLQAQIDERSREINTDNYPMSIGELASMYRDKEIEIHPEFQRFYRWTHTQKTRLIESILLGIPVPPIFVAQREDGVWDVVDGLQRLSTILEFMGLLKDENGDTLPPLELDGTRYLPALKEVRWGNDATSGRSLSDAQRLAFKREKLHVIIIKRQSHEGTKYELFQRLNSGGSQLSDQELRNCMLVNLNRAFYQMLVELAEYPAFKRCVPLTEKQVSEQYGLELVLRFVVLRRADPEDLQSIDVGEFLTDRMIALCQDPGFDLEAEKAAFHRTFDTLDEATGEDTFRHWDEGAGRATGAFSLSAYEVVAVGMGSHCDSGPCRYDPAAVRGKVHSIWSNPRYTSRSGSGARASWRLPHLIPLGRELFGDADAQL